MCVSNNCFLDAIPHESTVVSEEACIRSISDIDWKWVSDLKTFQLTVKKKPTSFQENRFRPMVH